jgi:DNA-binding transcriptional MerR regulator
MAWSTAELAELAGTSLRTVRHYHQVGLLDEPERGANGWKQYGLAHLARLREVVRLRELGFSIAEIHDLSNGASLDAALARLDEDLITSMTRLQQLRDEVASLAAAGPTGPSLPPAVSPDGLETITVSDRSFLILMSRLLDATVLDEFVTLLRATYAEPALLAFDDLADDADEETRADLVADLVEPVARIRATYGTYEEMVARGARDPDRALALIRTVLAEELNAAQHDVLTRVDAAVAARAAVAGGAS